MILLFKWSTDQTTCFTPGLHNHFFSHQYKSCKVTLKSNSLRFLHWYEYNLCFVVMLFKHSRFSTWTHMHTQQKHRVQCLTWWAHGLPAHENAVLQWPYVWDRQCYHRVCMERGRSPAVHLTPCHICTSRLTPLLQPGCSWKKVSLPMSQIFYSVTTVCAWQFVYAVCSCFAILVRTSLKTSWRLLTSQRV